LSTYLVNGVLVDVLFMPGEDGIVYCQKIKIIVKIKILTIDLIVFALQYLVLYFIIVCALPNGISENINKI
jgi:hypothetical protein